MRLEARRELLLPKRRCVSRSGSRSLVFQDLNGQAWVVYTLNLKCTMSPSCMIYSLPSVLILPFSLALTSLPAAA